MIVDRKKYRLYEAIITAILLAGVLLILPFGNFMLSIVMIIVAVIVHYLFKRWAKAEDERVIMISGKAARRALQVFGVGVVIIALIFFYFKPNLFSTELFEINTPSEDVFFPAWVALSPYDANIQLMENNITITIPSIYGNVTESVGNITEGNITKFSDMTFYLNNPKPADMFGIAFIISVAALWLLYLVFYDYYSGKYGEFSKEHEE